MAIGRSITQADVNNVLGQLAQQLFSAFLHVQQFNTWLGTQQASDLVALGFTSTEATGIINAMGDLDQLRTIFEGSAALATAKDFRTRAKLALGPGLY